MLKVKGRENPVERNLKDTQREREREREREKERKYSTYVLKNKYNFNSQKAEHFPDAGTGHLFTRLTGLV